MAKKLLKWDSKGRKISHSQHGGFIVDTGSSFNIVRTDLKTALVLYPPDSAEKLKELKETLAWE